MLYLIFLFFLIAEGGYWVEQIKTEYFFLGVGTNSPNAFYSAALENGVGTIFLKSYNNGVNWTEIAKGLEFMGIGCGSADEDEAVITGVLGKAEYTLWGGYAWKESIGFVPACQNVVHGRVDGMYGAAGGEGLAVSHDHGLTFIHHRIAGLNGSRYSSLPSDNTWYLTAGLWDEDDNNIDYTKYFKNNNNNNNNYNIKKYNINQRISLLYDQNNHQYSWYIKDNLISKSAKRKLQQSDSGIWGEIWKTTDRGNSWNLVYRSVGFFSFNAIDCCTVNVCYAVAEGDSDAGSSLPGSRILYTNNGGTTWDIVYWNELDGSSLTSIKCISETESWAAGGTIIEFNFHGYFYHTINSGMNWTSYEMNAPILFMDMSNNGQAGIASGLTKESQGVIYGFIP